MPSFTTSAGTTISLSASQPATYDQSGYEALTWTVIGGVTDLGQIPAKTFSVVTVQFVASRGTNKAKGGFDLGSQTITVAVDDSNAGQTMVDAATESDAAYSVKIDHPTEGTMYRQALVMGGPISYGDVNTPSTQAFTLEYTIVDDTEDGVVDVAAA